MESLGDFSFEATRWLQANYPQLEGFFTYLSALGRFEFYLAVVSLIYWSLHKGLGIALAYLLAVASIVNAILKHILRDPRPYWIEPALGLSAEEDYGIPSGHAQGAIVFFVLLAAWIRRGWVWILAFLLVFLMALSRIFLGVHDVPDVGAGILLGAALLLVFYLWRRYVAEGYNKRILGQRLLVAVIVPLALGSIYVALLLLIGRPDMTVAWASFIDTAETAGMNNVARAFALLLGLSIGFILESSRVRFLVSGPIWKRALRYLLGIAVTFALWQGLAILFPTEPLWLAIPLRIIRYLLISLWFAYYAPMTFVRLRLADASPEPEISLSI